MIDWYLVFTSALWILGLSIVLAAFSYHQWQAGVAGRRLREQLQRRSWTIAWTGGALLVCLGFALSEGSRWWERIAWLLLAASFTWQGSRAISAR
jgi:sulfite exporter TauE/SafE